MARFQVRHGDTVNHPALYVVWDTHDKIVAAHSDAKSLVIASAQRLNGFSPVNSNESTYGKQVEAADKQRKPSASTKATATTRSYEELRQDLLTLIDTSLSINDKLKINIDHVEFEGTMNDAEAFRQYINYVWHKYEGWVR
jgi:hypothetical protein